MRTGSRVHHAVARLCLAASLGVTTIAADAAPVANVSRTRVPFIVVGPDFPVVQAVFLTNVGDAVLNVSAITLTGKDAADFKSSGTCTAPSVLPPGSRCRIDIIMRASAAGTNPRAASLNIQSDSTPAAPTIEVSGNVQSEVSSTFALGSPAWIDFGGQSVGTSAPTQTLIVTNPEAFISTLASISLVGTNPADFQLTHNCALQKAFNGGASCALTIGFTPTTTGPRAAEVDFEIGFIGAGHYRFSITGVGGGGGGVLPTTVIEYYNAVLDHYFITWRTDEQAHLDAGLTPTRWSRTGLSFNTYTTPQAGTSPVCRYYIPPDKGDSHFFGRGRAECDATGQKNPTFTLEDGAFMQMILPVAGVCPAGTTNVYRVFSNRPDANHRYMTDKAVRDDMVAKGWIAEGDGPELVVMCAPQ